MLTYFDLVEHLITASFGGPQDAEQRDIRTACHRAYSEVTQIRDWAFYHAHGRVTTTAPYSTGTVEVASGVATLTGGSFASAGVTADNAKHWTLSIDSRLYPLSSLTSATVAGLDASFSGFSVPAGSPFMLYRTLYTLPEDFRNLDEPSDEYNWWCGLYVTPDEAMKLERVANSSGAPYHWTIIKDPHGYGWAIKLVGHPTQAESIDFIYRRSPRPIKYSGHEAAVRAGTITAASSSVTGTGTSFPPDAAGAILRVGTAADFPETFVGLRPPVSEVRIASRSSGTAITTEGTATASSSKYLITDPVDVPPHMHNVMHSGAEYWLARIRNQKPDNAFAMYQRDLRLAMEQDQLAPLSGRSSYIWHDGGWRSPLKPDEGE